MTSDRAGFSLPDGWELSGLTLNELWLSYFALGGTASQSQLADWTSGPARPGSYEHNIIAQAINEHFTSQGEDHPVSYEDLPPLP